MKYICLLLLSFLFISCNQTKIEIDLVPLPQKIIASNGVLEIENVFLPKSNQFASELVSFFETHQGRNISNNTLSKGTSVNYLQDESLAADHYRLQINDTGINISWSNKAAMINASTTLFQLVKNNELPYCTIEDGPDFKYRAVMLDCSRNWHDIATLKQIIKMCSWYKVNFLHLHLTDDALFTFPSTAFPKLASNKHYTLEDLKALNEFSNTLGVTLVPEIDMPGHSSPFINAMPELFGLKDYKQNPYTLNMGKESVYTALETLLTEVVEAFPSSPYIHIGGDEVFLEGFENDPDIQAYLKKNDLADVHELYRHFIVRIDEIVKAKGKQTIIWSDFTKEGIVQLPKDIIVMAWKPSKYLPAEMLQDGYSLINASWQPLYVVNNRKWTPAEIYNWQVNEWKGYQAPANEKGHLSETNENLLGASLAVWEQNQYKAFESLKERLPAMAERVWNNKQSDYDSFKERQSVCHNYLQDWIFPFSLEAKGLTFPDWNDPNFSEDGWFQDTLKLNFTLKKPNISLRYTSDGTIPNASSPLLGSFLHTNSNISIFVQAFQDKEPLGEALLKNYRLVPITFKAEGLANDLKPHSWDKHNFIDSVRMTLEATRPGIIRYTTDNRNPTAESTEYTAPFHFSNSGHIRATLFSEDGKRIGQVRSEEYEQLQLEESLTTGKPVETSNKFESGRPDFINDGKITRWDHWGAHTNGNNWLIVDLEKVQPINATKLYTFWDNYRYYEYTIQGSTDKENWTMLVDRSNNRELSVSEGTFDKFDTVQARYLKLRLIRNSANPGLHVVEFQAFHLEE